MPCKKNRGQRLPTTVSFEYTRKDSKTLENTDSSEGCGAKSGAVDAPCQLEDANLSMIINAWPSLADDVQMRVMALVRDAVNSNSTECLTRRPVDCWSAACVGLSDSKIPEMRRITRRGKET